MPAGEGKLAVRRGLQVVSLTSTPQEDMLPSRNSERQEDLKLLIVIGTFTTKNPATLFPDLLIQ